MSVALPDGRATDTATTLVKDNCVRLLKRGGKPCVRGLRITVYEVLEYLASEMSQEEILEDFPDLTREDLKACIAYAADRERRLMLAPDAA